MYRYEQKTGRFFHNDDLLCVGYSGFSDGKNDPLSQNRAGIGPIPQGSYSIGEDFESEKSGPVTMHLLPQTGTQTFGRSGFEMHGDAATHPGAASHGCIILPRPVRERVADGADKLLVVVSGAS